MFGVRYPPTGVVSCWVFQGSSTSSGLHVVYCLGDQVGSSLALAFETYFVYTFIGRSRTVTPGFGSTGL